MSNQSEMYIIKNNHIKNFTTLPNSIVQNENLSWKARGLLAYMLSLPNDWVFYDTELEGRSKKDGITSLRAALKELKENGYMKKERVIDPVTKRVTKWVTQISDEPVFLSQIEKTHIVESQIEKTHIVESQEVENLTLQRTNNTNNLNIQNTNTNNSPPHVLSKELDSKSKRNNEEDEKSKELFRVIQENIKPVLTPYEMETVQYWVKDYDFELIKEAVRTTIMNSVKRLAYPETLLKDWDGKGIKSLSELKHYQENNKQRGNNGWGNQQSNKPVAKKKYKDGDIMPGGVVYESIYDF